MNLHPLAGKAPPEDLLTNVPRLVSSYFALTPDPADPRQRVAFGTSGHRGSSLEASFNEMHVLAMTQAICTIRHEEGIFGPLYLGIDTHALSEPAWMTALEVLAKNQVEVFLDRDGGYTPTPVISHAILGYNREHGNDRADGIIITPSHNPPSDGGFKYNPPHGGPADSSLTQRIEKLANQHLADGCLEVRRMAFAQAIRAVTTHRHDFVGPYVEDLATVLDLERIRSAGLRLGVDPMGGASVGYWGAIAERYGLNLTVVQPSVDPTFRFMPVDHDGKIRMDCSSPYAMSHLVELRDRYDVAFGNDADADRHGIVTRSAGLLNPNHYLAVAIDYLFRQRPAWAKEVAVGKTVVSSSLIDRVTAGLGRRLVEVPVGFKWFVQGLLEHTLGFGGEESAGASFLRKDGSTWTTDKDGLLLDLLAAEITATLGRDPAEIYHDLVRLYGEPVYARSDAPASAEEKAVLKRLSPGDVTVTELAGDCITAVLTRSPANGAKIGGIKVTTDQGWFAVRPSGTEDVYKIYAESFRGPEHLAKIQEEARSIVDTSFSQARV